MDANEYVITYNCRVSDDTLLEDFVNTFRVTVLPAAKKPGGNGFSPNRPDKNKPGTLEIPTGISLPKVTWVTKAEWPEHKFDKYSALNVVTFSDDKKKEQDRRFDLLRHDFVCDFASATRIEYQAGVKFSLIMKVIVLDVTEGRPFVRLLREDCG